MDALEFLKTAKRRYKSNPDGHYSAVYFDDPDFESYIKNVEEWGKNNPTKTRQTEDHVKDHNDPEFIKMFPNVQIRRDGYIDIAPCNLDKKIYEKCSKSSMKCDECYKKFWGKEVE